MFNQVARIPTSSTSVDEDNRCRHWSRESQAYAPVDVLINYIHEGWTLDALGVKTFYFAGYRGVDVYYFTLRRDPQTLEMPVVANPVIRRLIRELGLTPCPYPSGRSELYE